MGQELTRQILSRYGKQWRRNVQLRIDQLEAATATMSAALEKEDFDKVDEISDRVELLMLAWEKPVGSA